MSFVTFLSDYGLQDEYVGVCHGVILRRAPQAQIIDITHSIPRHEIAAGALLLAAALPYTPAAVHLAVVDPGVGASARRAVAIACRPRQGGETHHLVGPDNGLLPAAARRLGEITEVVEISDSPVRLQPTSATFHGRDIFAPVAGALAAGTPLRALGEPLAARSLVELPSAAGAPARKDALPATVVHVDAFGNLTLDLAPQALLAAGCKPGAELQIEPLPAPGERAQRPPLRARLGSTFSDVPPGAAVLHTDSRNLLALAINCGSAAQALGVGHRARLLIRLADDGHERSRRAR
ncbi:MAG TPA: SAM-dependent chlorinase/fluorinase [Solirubrobacteraceae bacterium]|nr:SAM-dependent chlorinase/fluorinase [Solirubrobacteraceae bacterium]